MDNSTTSKNELESLLSEKEKLITKFFWFMVEIALVFAIPAGIVLGISFYVEERVEFYLLPISFVTSWIIVLIRFSKLNKKMKKLDSDISNLKDNS
jgi:Na+-driven multidrug efflux pump